LYVFALRQPIELFGYFSIVFGSSWYFFIIVFILAITWFIAGMISRSIVSDLMLAIVGILYSFVAIVVSATTIPMGSYAYDMFNAGFVLIFTPIDSAITFVICFLVCFIPAAVGSTLAKHIWKDNPKSKCPPELEALGLCK
jgi:hypothetical protein